MSGVHPPAGAFLPLTLSQIRDTPTVAGRPSLAPLADRALAAERAAEDSWHALLGDCACARRGHFADHLRELSEAAGSTPAGTGGAAGAASTATGWPSSSTGWPRR
ncbi:MAG TPA: hypothetical protein VNP03_12605 [Pseudonocardia sp.]|nr:hypothetical protein [Pseudonocardia sp.]